MITKNGVQATLNNIQQVLTIKQCRYLLNIGSRDTMNDYLKTLGFFGSKTLNWSEFRALLSLQIFLGLKHGCNSRAMFTQLNHQELMKIFEDYGINIEQRFRRIQADYYYTSKTHRVSVH